MESLVVSKVIAMVVLGLSSLIMGLLPIKLVRVRGASKSAVAEPRSPLAVSLLLCFGGGVLLFTTFMHLQPEVREATEQLIQEGRIPDPGSLNAAELIFCAGFFLVYTVEEVVHSLLESHRSEDEEAILLRRTVSIRRCGGPQSAGSDLPVRSTGSTQVLVKTESPQPTGESLPNPASVTRSVRGLVALVALSFHAVFEGLAVGLERSPTQVWALCGALATHKLVIAFCLGVELVSSRSSLVTMVIYVATFACVTPLGIGLGVLLGSADAPGLDIASVVLQGMAAGTLLYVVFFEVLHREKSTGHHGLIQLLAIITGFALMLALQILLGHDHKHGSHGDENPINNSDHQHFNHSHHDHDHT